MLLDFGKQIETLQTKLRGSWASSNSSRHHLSMGKRLLVVCAMKLHFIGRCFSYNGETRTYREALANEYVNSFRTVLCKGYEFVFELY